MVAIAVIQARTGSNRLPGKVMYPLDGRPTLEHVVDRVNSAQTIDKTVVATSTNHPDNVIDHYAPTFGAAVVRRSESDVLSRFDRAVEQYDPEIVVRVTGNCPLVSPRVIDASIDRIRRDDIDYVCAGLERTFPRGLTCEAFTAKSFARVSEASSEPRHREHVTPYYREHPEECELYNLESDEVFDEPWLQGRTDLRLALDEPADYQLLETVYREVKYEKLIDIADAIKHTDENNLGAIYEYVEQKSV